MTKSPGHRDHPEHKVEERHASRRMKVEVDGQLLADSDDVLEVEEDGNPVRYYFPQKDATMPRLTRSGTTSRCPYKGRASYYNVQSGDRVLPDAVWSYEDPYEEHAALKDRVAFYTDKYPEIAIRAA